MKGTRKIAAPSHRGSGASVPTLVHHDEHDFLYANQKAPRPLSWYCETAPNRLFGMACGGLLAQVKKHGVVRLGATVGPLNVGPLNSTYEPNMAHTLYRN